MNDFRKKFHLVKDAKVDKIKPGHGTCCTCQVCGYHYDDCMCTDNVEIEACEYIEQLETENKRLRESFEQEAIRLLNVIKQLKAKNEQLEKWQIKSTEAICLTNLTCCYQKVFKND